MNKFIKRLSILALLTIALTVQADANKVGTVEVLRDNGFVTILLYESAKSEIPISVAIYTNTAKAIQGSSYLIVTSGEARKIAALIIEAAKMPLTSAVTVQADANKVGTIEGFRNDGFVIIGLRLSQKSKTSVDVWIFTATAQYNAEVSYLVVTSDEARKIAALIIEAADLIDGTP